jgi:hypothetical protein
VPGAGPLPLPGYAQSVPAFLLMGLGPALGLWCQTGV